jgi:hypothetical protein
MLHGYDNVSRCTQAECSHAHSGLTCFLSPLQLSWRHMLPCNWYCRRRSGSGSVCRHIAASLGTTAATGRLAADCTLLIAAPLCRLELATSVDNCTCELFEWAALRRTWMAVGESRGSASRLLAVQLMRHACCSSMSYNCRFECRCSQS